MKKVCSTLLSHKIVSSTVNRFIIFIVLSFEDPFCPNFRLSGSGICVLLYFNDFFKGEVTVVVFIDGVQIEKACTFTYFGDAPYEGMWIEMGLRNDARQQKMHEEMGRGYFGAFNDELDQLFG